MLDNIEKYITTNFDYTEDEICNIYVYGSYIYNTFNDNSDIDVLCVVRNDIEEYVVEQSGTKLSLHFISVNKFFYKLNSFTDMVILESYLSPAILKKTVFTYDYSLTNNSLRKLISSTASNSFVKAKKKILQGDYYLGIKSLFHSLRILGYGIQLAKDKEINNWGCSNEVFFGLLQQDKFNLLLLIEKEYKPMYNKLKSEFKQVCPLEK